MERLVGLAGSGRLGGPRGLKRGRCRHHVRQGETVVRERVGEPRVSSPPAELVPDTGLAQVGLDEENRVSDAWARRQPG